MTAESTSDELFVFDVVLGQVAVTQVDAAFEILAVGGHVLQADRVVEARAGTPDRRDDEVAGPDEGHVRPDRLDLAETLVTDHEEVIAAGRGPVLGGVDLTVRAVDTHAEDFDEHAPPVGDVGHRRDGELGEMRAVGGSWKYCDGLHDVSAWCGSANHGPWMRRSFPGFARGADAQRTGEVDGSTANPGASRRRVDPLAGFELARDRPTAGHGKN
jgi:hypothetical protein